MKEVGPYLNFNGNCRDAMKFYQRCLGGELYIMPFSEAPMDFPEEAKDRIMHSTLRIGPIALMGSDTMPGTSFREGNNFSIYISPENSEETERLFTALAEKGKITMPLQDTFWGARFGTITDQFGINWMLNFEKPKQ